MHRLSDQKTGWWKNFLCIVFRAFLDGEQLNWMRCQCTLSMAGLFEKCMSYHHRYRGVNWNPVVGMSSLQFAAKPKKLLRWYSLQEALNAEFFDSVLVWHHASCSDCSFHVFGFCIDASKTRWSALESDGLTPWKTSRSLKKTVINGLSDNDDFVERTEDHATCAIDAEVSLSAFWNVALQLKRQNWFYSIRKKLARVRTRFLDDPAFLKQIA